MVLFCFQLIEGQGGQWEGRGGGRESGDGRGQDYFGDKLQVQIAGETAPDIVWMSGAMFWT